ncbi:hypothetical protein [Pedobacter sp. Leaf216]|uniref:hypothetical protein n=1 Tax=Pedobacter sp. Leaf216 TaxID=1735684 RepID=UPI000AC5E9DC|nr:hypothetical protein [Pedobacter sp. Leaf216]
MIKNYKIFFIPALLFITMLNPACKHGTNDGIELYRRYAIKNIISKKIKKAAHHD